MKVLKKKPREKRSSSRKVKRGNSVSTLDLWLQRLSHFAQVGLFFFTIWTIYFTVIPLYQKALLDEQIAQKEILLRKLEKEVVHSYEKIRFSALRDYVFHAGAECSGLMISPEELKKYYEPASKKDNRARAILAIKPNDCLTKALDQVTSLKELNSGDVAFLKAKVVRLASGLERNRQLNLSRLGAAEETVRKNPSMIGPLDGKPGTTGELVLKSVPLAKRKSFLTWVAVEAEQYDAAEAYAAEVRSALTALYRITWPEPQEKGL